jgi:hypothetical protein
MLYRLARWGSLVDERSLCGGADQSLFAIMGACTVFNTTANDAKLRDGRVIGLFLTTG